MLHCSRCCCGVARQLCEDADGSCSMLQNIAISSAQDMTEHDDQPAGRYHMCDSCVSILELRCASQHAEHTTRSVYLVMLKDTEADNNKNRQGATPTSRASTSCTSCPGAPSILLLHPCIFLVHSQPVVRRWRSSPPPARCQRDTWQTRVRTLLLYHQLRQFAKRQAAYTEAAATAVVIARDRAVTCATAHLHLQANPTSSR